MCVCVYMKYRPRNAHLKHIIGTRMKLLDYFITCIVYRYTKREKVKKILCPWPKTRFPSIAFKLYYDLLSTQMDIVDSY